MATEAHNKAITDLLPDTLIELFEIQIGDGRGIKRFHPGKIVDKDIILGGNKYYCLPIEATGFESKGDGALPRPKLIIANPDGLISDMIKREDDMVGKTFKRIRIFLKFLDEVNFPETVNPFANSDPESRFDDDLYVFNRKVSENKYFVEFELVSPLEVQNYKLPARIMIANYCPWKYRGIGCRYGARGDMDGPTTELTASDGVTKLKSVDFFPQKESGQLVTVTKTGGATIDKVGGYTVGSHTSAPGVTVDALPVALRIGNKLNFGATGAVFTLSANAVATATTIYGTLADEDVANDAIGTLSYPVGNYSSSTGIIVEELPLPISFGQAIRFASGARFILDADANIDDTEIFGDLTVGALEATNGGRVVLLDRRVQGVPVADEKDKRFDDPNSGFNLKGMRWVYEYNPTLFSVALSSATDAGDSVVLSVDNISQNINPNRAITLSDSGGSEIGLFQVTALARKTATVELTVAAANAATSITVKPVLATLKKGETITFSATESVLLTKDVTNGDQVLDGTVSTGGSPIAIGSSGTLRTKITGNLVLTTGSAAPATATGIVGYVKGDVVSITSLDGNPPSLFVCIQDHTLVQDPRFKKEYWVEDQCSKTLNGCKMRFGEYHHLPFGGFPSIEAYRYTN
jgi:lambda family phage minor tail protein L